MKGGGCEDGEKTKRKRPRSDRAAEADCQEEGRGGDNAVPGTARRVLEYPKRPDEVVSDKVIFDIGGDRFALHWRAEIERLPPARPILVEQKQPQKPVRSPQKRR